MDIRSSIHLLTVSVLAILALLFLVVAYTLSSTASTALPAVSTIAPGAGPSTAPTESPALLAGKKIWKEAGCNACHAKDMRTDLTGPALGGVTNRWADYPREDLYAWIRNSGKLIASGHPRAEALITKWKKPMTAYPKLSDEDIEALLAYIER